MAAPQRDFLTHLLNDQIKIGYTNADGLLARFATDLDKLTTLGDNLKSGALSKAVIDTAIADYYFMQNGFSGKDFFNAITGGIQFDLKDIGANWSSNKTVGLLDDSVITQLLNVDQQARTMLFQDNAWSIQSGSNALNATGTGANNDAMLGGIAGDILDGGAGNDFLYGGDGADTLTGGTGNNHLEGGAGSDTYHVGSGSDTIYDSDGQGTVYTGTGQLAGGAMQGDASHYQSADGAHSYTLAGDMASSNGAMLIVDGNLTIEHFHNNDLGITLDNQHQVPQPTPDPLGQNGQLPYSSVGHLTDPNPAVAILPPLTAYNDRVWGWADGLNLVSGMGGDDQLYAEDPTGIDTASAILNGNTRQGTDQTGVFLYGNTGNDTLVGSDRKDELYGGAGQDLLIGGAGNDTLEGDAEFFLYEPGYASLDATPETGADDTLYAGNGDDKASGGKGNDVILGEGGNDTLYGDDSGLMIIVNGTPTLLPENLHGNDFMDGGEGNDTIYGQGGNDTLYGGAGDDLMYGEGTGELVAGNDYLNGEDGNDTLYGNGGDDTLLGGAGDDKVYGGEGTNYLDGGDGNDTLNSGGPGSALYGGLGNDDLSAAGGGNYLDGGDGTDTLLADGGNNELFGGTSDDTLTASGDNNYLDSEDGNDILSADGGNNQLFGGAGDDDLAATGGNNYLDGEGGNNTLYANSGSNTLIAGAGNDNLSAGGGNNTLDGGDGTNSLIADGGNNTLRAGAGNDYLSSSGGGSTLDGGDGSNTLVADMGGNTLVGGTGGDTLSATGGFNTLTAGNGNNTLIATGGNNTLISGTGNDSLSSVGGGSTLEGGDGNDTLVVDGNNNTLMGGVGNDTLQGGDGNDVYVYNIGDGVDHIVDSSAGSQINTLRFGNGISVSNIVLRLGSLMLDMGNGDVIHIDNFNPNDAANSSTIQRFEFADGASYTAQQLVTTLGFDLDGTAGNDTITGTSANDRISGGAGADALYGGQGNDTLSGGQGNDTLSGSIGNDTYIYNAGDGMDVILDSRQHYSPATGGMVTDTNTLGFGAGITAGSITAQINPATSQVTLHIAPPAGSGQTGGNINIGSSGDLAIQSLQFADGTTLAMDTLLPQTNFSINGSVLSFGAGITPDMLTPRRTSHMDGQQCVLDLGPSAGSGQAGASVAIGSLKDLIIHGVFDNNPFDFFDIKTLQFADGTTISVQDFVMQRGLTQTGTAGADTLYGEDARSGWIPDRLEGGAGNDTLVGCGGSDIYVFNRGDGADTIKDGAGWQYNRSWGWMPGGDNTLVFGVGIAAGDIFPVINPATNQLVLNLGNSSTGSGQVSDSVNIGPASDLAVQNIQFADGTMMTVEAFLSQHEIATTGTSGADSLYGTGFADRLQGLGGDDYLVGNTGQDALAGGTGNDHLNGGAGSDTYIYNLGDGADTIVDSGWLQGTDLSGQPIWTAQPNTLSFGAGITADTVTPLWDSAAGTLTLDMGNGDSIAIGSLTDIAIQNLRFSDGTSLAMDAFLAQKGVIQLMGTPGNDVMVSPGNGQPLQGLGGNDTLYGSVLNDTLQGGAGNDTLIGNYGNDTFIYNIGDGADTIVDSHWGDWGQAEWTNTLSFGAGITADMIIPVYDSVSRSIALDLGAASTGSGQVRDSINIGLASDQVDQSLIAIQNLQFADGSVFTLDNFITQAGSFQITATAGDYWVDGTQFADYIAGSAGSDNLRSYDGNDTLVGGKGNDVLEGGRGNDTYIFNRGDGVDSIADAPYSWVGESTVDEVNTLVLGGGITASVIDTVVDSSGNVKLDFGMGDSVHIQQQGNLAIQQVTFADGTILSMDQVLLLHNAPAPVPNLTNHQVATQDQPFSFIVPPDAFWNPTLGANLIFSATMADTSTISGQAPLPSWLILNTATGTFSGVPTNWDIASLNITVTATAAPQYIPPGLIPPGYFPPAPPPGSSTGGPSSSYNFVLDVLNVNDAPTVAHALGDQSASKGQAFSFTMPGNTFDDVDFIHGDHLIYNATLADGSALPGWLAFDAVAGTFNGTPGHGDAGTLNLMITAADTGGLSASIAFNLGIASANAAPTSRNDAVAIDQNSAQTVITAASLLANDTDPDAGDVLVLSGFDGVTANGNAVMPDASGNLVLDIGGRYQSLGAGQTATDSFSYTISDTSGASSTATVDVTITGVNDAPSVANALTDQGTQQDAAFRFTIPSNTFTDIDQGDVLTCSATMADGSALPSWLTFDAATGTFSGTPDNRDVGNLNVMVIVTDAGGLTASSNFALEVINVNDPPVAAGDTGAATEDGGAVILSAADLLANDADPDLIHGDVLNVIGVSQAASGAMVSSVNGNVQYDPSTSSGQGIGNLYQSLGAGQTATDTFSYTIADMAGATSAATVTMTITGVNDAPVTADDAAAVREDTTIAATGNVLANDTDVDAGTVLGVANAGTLQGSYGSLVLNADGNYTYALDNASAAVQGLMAGQVVTDAFVYQATDGLVSTPATLTVTITGTNDAPVIAVPLSGMSTLEDQPFNFRVPANTFTDIDHGDTLAFGASMADGSALPPWLKFDAVTQTFSGAPSNRDVANYNVAVTATDSGGLSATSTFSLDVINVNDAPIVANPLADRHFDEHKKISFVLPANTFDDWDIIHGDSLSYSATLADGHVLPSWLRFDAATRTFSGTPEESGSWDVRLTATDMAGASVSQLFSLGNETHSGDSGSGGHSHKPIDKSQDQSFVGSKANDIIHTGNGADTITFNRGGGQDSLYGGIGTDNTLILGGGIRYADLALSKVGNDLILEVSPISTGSGQAGEQITLKNWYDTRANYKSVLNLQVVADATATESHSRNTGHENILREFDFTALVNSFDQARGSNDTYSHWSAMNTLLTAHLESGTAVLGGDMTYQYGTSGMFAGMNLAAAQNEINDPQFGPQSRTLRSLQGLQGGGVSLG